MPESKIAKFEKNLKEFSENMKKQKLLEAIELAKKLMSEQREKGEEVKASENEQNQVFTLLLSRFLRFRKRSGKMSERKRLMG